MRPIIYLIAIVTILTAGCGQPDKNKGKGTSDETSKQESSANEKIVARVNSRPIYESEIRDRELNDIIADGILYDDALRRGFDKDRAIQKRLAEYQMNLYVTTLMGRDKNFASRLAANISKEQVVERFQKQNPHDRKDSDIREDSSEKPKEADADELIKREGRRLGLDKDEDTQRRFQSFKKRLVLREYKKKLISDLPELDNITQHQITKFYKENQIEYTTLDLVFVSLRDRKAAEEIHKRAKAGEDLKTLFDEYRSTKPESNIIFRKLFYNDQYSKMLSQKGIGGVSDVLKEGKNYKILKVTNVRVAPISRVEAAIKFHLLMEKRNRELRKIANSIAQKNNVKVEIYVEDNRI